METSGTLIDTVPPTKDPIFRFFRLYGSVAVIDRQKLLTLGISILAFALFLGSLSPFVQSTHALFEDPQILSLAMYLHTGRVLRYPQSVPAVPEATEPTAPSVLPDTKPEWTPPVEEKPSFSPEDAQALSMIHGCHYYPDIRSLLLSELSWDLTDGQPAVLIIHTHATESYRQTADASYEESGVFRTLDERYNLVSIGDEVARVLTEHGIAVIHDRSFHDYPAYNGSYVSARNAIAQYLAQYPSIRMVLDLHRDASSSSPDDPMTTHATVAGQSSAQLEVVIGTDYAGNYHPNWQTNLALGLKLTAQLERIAPGITRPLYLRSERFNMDMTPGSLLIEVGAVGNTHEEALIAANVLAQGIIALAKGTK